MTQSIPNGTRDVLPDEMQERLNVIATVREVFESHNYGEVSTPAVEFASVMERAGLDTSGDAARPRFRTVDEHGRSLVLRADMTASIARMVGTRMAESDGPIRLSYVGTCYRGVLPGRGDAREILQAGIELCGSKQPGGTVEALEVLIRTLQALGLQGARVAVGDAGFFPRLLTSVGIEESQQQAIIFELETGDFVGLRRELLQVTDADTTEMLCKAAVTRGEPAMLSEIADPRIAAAAEELKELVGLLSPELLPFVVIDFGLVRRIGYYTGAVFAVYAPGQGHAIGSGGRYDDLLGRFGPERPAVGFALDIDALHTALVGTARGRWRIQPGGASA